MTCKIFRFSTHITQRCLIKIDKRRIWTLIIDIVQFFNFSDDATHSYTPTTLNNCNCNVTNVCKKKLNKSENRMILLNSAEKRIFCSGTLLHEIVIDLTAQHLPTTWNLCLEKHYAFSFNFFFFPFLLLLLHDIWLTLLSTTWWISRHC